MMTNDCAWLSHRSDAAMLLTFLLRIVSTRASPGQTATSEHSDAKHWHERAAEARAIANQTEDDIARGVLLRIAFEYEKIASQAAARRK
jgi:hypothetical protein